MNWTVTVYSAILFFLLTPGILLSLPSKGSGKITIAAVHAIAFAIVWHFTHKIVWKMSVSEGFAPVADKKRVRSMKHTQQK